MHTAVAPIHVERLLAELCLKLGFSTPVYELPRFLAAVPAGVNAFTDLVLTVEGLDPAIDRALHKQVHEVVASHFASWSTNGTS